MSKEQEPPPASLSFEHVTRLAREVLLRDGYHLPTVIVDGSQQPVIVQIPEMAPTHEERAAQMYVAGAILGRDRQAGRLRQAFFVTEGWMSVAREGSLPAVPPSQDPQRKEMLVVTGYESSTQHTRMALYEMKRDPEGVLRELLDYEYGTGNRIQAENPLLEAFVQGFASGGASS